MKIQRRFAALTVALLTFTSQIQAQSTDALLDKLVQKGILSVREANDLRGETDKNFATSLSSRMGMPDWVTALKLNGDARFRYERFDSANSAFVKRTRFRYRIRFGVTAQLWDDFEVGFRLTSGEPSGNFGGSPLSANSTFQDNGSRKFVYLDEAFARWTPWSGPNFFAKFTVGKMESPFVLSDLVLDPDYTPEGIAAQLAYEIGGGHTLRVNGGAFVVDELSDNTKDPYLLGGQARWDAKWTRKFQTSVGITGLLLQNSESITNSLLPNINRGNTHDVFGALVYQYHALVLDASATYLLDGAPFYAGPFPIRIAGDYLENLEASGDSTGNYGYSVSVALGKVGKKKTWELSYTYKYLSADAWWEEMEDDDFGGFYAGENSPPNSGQGLGFGGGTNVRGHIARFAFSPSDYLTFSVKLFLTELINTYPATYPATTTKSQMSRLQVDASWRF